jgi:hypothetical protein
MTLKKRISYTLELEFKDGRPGYRVYQFDNREQAENVAKVKRIGGRYKNVKVIEESYTIGGQSVNECMLTIAR